MRIDALRIEVHGHRDDVHVAGALAVAEQRAFDAVGAREQAELAGRDRAAAIVVRVQAHADVLALRYVAAKILDLIGEHVRRRHLDGGRQIDDDLAAALRLPHVDHGVADFDA